MRLTIMQSFLNNINTTTGWPIVQRTEDLMVRSSIPAVVQGHLIFPALKDERYQEQLHSPGVER